VRIAGAIDGGVVQYIIFELADGDLRQQVSLSRRFDVAWILRALHHASTGMWQLHRAGIVHQDIKPSNLLVFAGNVTKVADLGRAASKGVTPPHEQYEIPGDPTYAPPELLYGYLDSEWDRRRLAGDAYLLGGLVVFCFTGTGMTAQLRAALAPGHVWRTWPGTFDEVVPYLREAFERVTEEFSKSVPDEQRADVVALVRELCDPDPGVRGHASQRLKASSQYSLERYVTRFDLLARRAEASLRGSKSA
jgi:eukaryotic-like serine/threonine-protein kinase